jgi:hypothetical protein
VAARAQVKSQDGLQGFSKLAPGVFFPPGQVFQGGVCGSSLHPKASSIGIEGFFLILSVLICLKLFLYPYTSVFCNSDDDEYRFWRDDAADQGQEKQRDREEAVAVQAKATLQALYSTVGTVPV